MSEKKKAEWEDRVIPKSDKALRSLYMPESYTRNLKGKGKKIRWSKETEKLKPRDDYDVGHDLDEQYTYLKTSGKESTSGIPTYQGEKIQRLRASKKSERPESRESKSSLSEDILSQETDRHQSLKTKGGGYDTIRIKNKSLDVNSPIRSGGRRYKQQKITQEIQDKKGKIQEKHDLIKNKKKLKNLLLLGVEKEKADRIAEQVKAGYGGDWLKDMDLKKSHPKKKHRKLSNIREL
tara:strand:+ start:38 stop:745 length:708 start_codon:yes stop_codon:yes gene_type:complete